MLRHITAVGLLVFSISVQAKQLTDTVDSLTQQWLDIERQESQLENDWREQKPAMQQRIQLLKAEKAQLEAILAQSTDSQGDVEEQRNALLAEQSELEADQQQVAQQLSGLQSQVTNLYTALPTPLQTQWDAEQSQLTEHADTSMQLQVLLAKLSQLQRFNHALTVNKTVMTTDSGQEVMVKQFYLGAGYAWFTNVDGQYQGIGRVINGEWQWQFTPDVTSSAVATAIAIYEKKQEPGYVELPIELSSTSRLQEGE